MKKLIVLSENKDPYLNQAMEACLFYEYKAYDEILFLYVNRPSVVIGRNQIPWKEVQIENAREMNVDILRRLSGGGTVYHDEKNINFSFIYNKKRRSIPDNFEVIVKAVEPFGIDLLVTERKDLFYKGRKVSGNAFYNRANRSMHHGTLLIDVETSHLWQILNFNHTDYTSRSVKSVKSPIVNLKALNEAVTVKKVIENISNQFDSLNHLTGTDVFMANEKTISDLYKKYADWQWIFGETPQFQYQHDHHNFTVDKGKIVKIDGSDYHQMMLNQIFSEEAIKEVKDVSRII